MKRKRGSALPKSANKRPRLLDDTALVQPVIDLIRRYYTHVCTLRQYLLRVLPKGAKKRRRIVFNHGRCHDAPSTTELAIELDMLDKTVVACQGYLPSLELDDIVKEISIATQQLTGSTVKPGSTPQRQTTSDVVDHCIARLRRAAGNEWKGLHLLCPKTLYNSAREEQDPQQIRIRQFKSHPWSILPSLLGSRSDEILYSLFLDCGVFRYAADGSNILQVSGIPLSDLTQTQGLEADRSAAQDDPKDRAIVATKPPKITGLSDLMILRHRILYGRPSRHSDSNLARSETQHSTNSWKTHHGLPQRHILARLQNVEDPSETVQLAKHVFPQEFGLPNVFVCKDSKTIASRTYQEVDFDIQAYNNRQLMLGRSKGRPDERVLLDLPKRLRGRPLQMLQTLRVRQHRLRWWHVFDHYCPKPKGIPITDSVALATPHSRVSAFCRAATFAVFGKKAFGLPNVDGIRRKIDTFVRLRRRESVSVHDLLDGISIIDIPWLVPEGFAQTTKMSRTDHERRRQLMAAFLHYVFESFLIPLIKTQFHVTDARDYSNRLFFYRHDVFESMSAPALMRLKCDVLEELPTRLSKQTTGVNFVRLVPKERGMRPIINLRRQGTTVVNGKRIQGTSVNSRLQPAFQALNFACQTRPNVLGGGIFSVNEILHELKQYRASLHEQGLDKERLYFVKIDVKACFDSLPHNKLIDIIEHMLEHEEYVIKRYGRGRLLGGHDKQTAGFGARVKWAWAIKASDRLLSIENVMADLAEVGSHKAVFIDGRTQTSQSRTLLLRQLRAHVECNLIGIGGRLYRQKTGVAQGSIVSTLLCTLLYGQMEHEVLAFTQRPDTKLLRLIDDFLLITANKDVAERFARTMHHGLIEYGVQIKLEKTLVNFDLLIQGQPLHRTAAAADFPYCAYTVNTVTLDLGRDLDRLQRVNVGDTVSVEHGKIPGQSYYHKTLGVVLLMMRGLIVSTAHNAVETVFVNLFYFYQNLVNKSHHYIRSLAPARQPPAALVIRTMNDAIKLSHRIVIRHRPQHKVGEIGAAHVRWIACKAIVSVLQQRQTKYRTLLAWAHKQMRSKALARLEPQLLLIVGKCL